MNVLSSYHIHVCLFFNLNLTDKDNKVNNCHESNFTHKNLTNVVPTTGSHICREKVRTSPAPTRSNARTSKPVVYDT